MKEKKITEVFWNIIFIETSKKYGENILYNEDGLKELNDMIALIEHYMIVMSKTNFPMNDLLFKKELLTQEKVDVMSKLLANRQKDYTIRGTITEKDVKEFIEDTLKTDNLFSNVYDEIKLNQDTDKPITYKEIFDCIYHDVICKPYIKEVYLDELETNSRYFEDNSIISETITDSLAKLFEIFDPIRTAKDESDFLIMSNFIVSIYIKLLSIMYSALTDVVNQEVSRKSPVINIVVPMMEPMNKLIHKLFGYNPFVCGKVQEKRMSVVFDVFQDVLSMMTDALVNKGKVITKLSYYGNIGVFNLKNQKKVKELFNYIITTFPNIINYNIHNVVPYKVTGVKKEPTKKTTPPKKKK